MGYGVNVNVARGSPCHTGHSPGPVPDRDAGGCGPTHPHRGGAGECGEGLWLGRSGGLRPGMPTCPSGGCGPGMRVGRGRVRRAARTVVRGVSLSRSGRVSPTRLQLTPSLAGRRGCDSANGRMPTRRHGVRIAVRIRTGTPPRRAVVECRSPVPCVARCVPRTFRHPRARSQLGRELRDDGRCRCRTVALGGRRAVGTVCPSSPSGCRSSRTGRPSRAFRAVQGVRRAL